MTLILIFMFRISQIILLAIMLSWGKSCFKHLKICIIYIIYLINPLYIHNFSASTARPKNFKEIFHPVQQNLKNVSIVASFTIHIIHTIYLSLSEKYLGKIFRFKKS